MTSATLRLLERTARAPAGGTRPTEDAGPGEDGGRILVCARCLHAVTTNAARIEMGGRHAHTYANPEGFVFHIGCFAVAPGCLTASAPSTFYSWFPGYAWQVALCRACGEHLGWLFLSADSRFHGLILDRLVEQEGSDE